MGEEELNMDLLNLDFDDIVDDIESPDIDEDLKDEEQESKDNIKEEEPSEEDAPEIVATGAEEDDPEKKEEDGEDDTSPNAFKSLATILFEEGVIPSADSSSIESTKSVEDLVSLIQKQVEANEFSHLSDVQKEYLEALKAGLPTERFDAHKRAEQQLESITEDVIKENENLRKQLIFKDFKARGYSDEKAAKLTQRSFESEEDIEDAISAHKALKETILQSKKEELEKLKKIQEDEEKKITKDREDLKKLVFETDNIIKGFNITEGMKKKIYSNIINPVSTDPKTGKQENILMKYRRENPQEFMHKLYYLFTVTKNFKDFSYFTNKARTDSVRELEDAMRRSTHVASGGDPSFIDDKDSFDSIIGDELVLD